jgi:DNA polymerase-4
MYFGIYMGKRTIIHIDLDSFFVSVERVLNPTLNAFGLYSGMPLVTAARLCPEAIFIEGNFAKYREFSRKFMAILNDFSPFIEPRGLDEAYLDVTGFESLHGSIRKMATAMKQRIKSELGLTASIGISSCKIVAKVASDYSKPDGLVEVKSSGEREFLAPLSVDKLPGVGKHTVKVLKGLGIHTIGALSQMPSSTLKNCFGSAGETMHRL